MKAGPQATVFSAIVKVMGINDSPPMFPPKAYIPLSEDVLVDTLFHFAAATDQDVGDTAVIMHEIDYALVANQDQL